MSCTICINGWKYPAHAHTTGCPVRANLDAAQAREREAAKSEPTIGEFPTCGLAMCGGACGADICGT